jgi:hypothetical protein
MQERNLHGGILALVVALHVVALQWWLIVERGARRAPAVTDVRVEMKLVDMEIPSSAVDPDLQVRRGDSASERAPASTVASESMAPAELSVRTEDAPRATLDPLDRVRLVGDDGRPRISPRLLETLDASRDAARVARFHVPLGDTWVLRERRSPIDYAPTKFADAWLPEGMNPVEEACWRNRGLAFVLSMLGSTDCANPGGPTPRPTPEMIRYGEDSVADILRKREDWARYDRR